jgi:hypothetical protein
MKNTVISMVLFVSIQPLLGVSLDTNKKIETISKKYLGDPYVWGGNTPETGMDCSGYTKYVFNKVGINIPRTAYSQSKVGKEIPKDELEKGDLLFFLTDKSRGIPITHVGIYLGENKFIHAASRKKGIIISSMKKSYGEKFVSARRMINKKNAPIESFLITLDNEAMKSSMGIKLTSFGGINTTF